MAKKVTGYIKLQIPAGKGNTGSACWSGSWTARCEHRTVHKSSSTQEPQIRADLIIPVVITVYADRSFQLHHKDSACSSSAEEGLQAEVRFRSSEQD